MLVLEEEDGSTLVLDVIVGNVVAVLMGGSEDSFYMSSDYDSIDHNCGIDIVYEDFFVLENAHGDEWWEMAQLEQQILVLEEQGPILFHIH